MAAVLACGDGAVLSHTSAAAVWGLTRQGRSVEVTVPGFRCPAHPGIAIHRRSLRPEDATERDRIPVTSVVRTLLDLACRLSAPRLERAVNEADKFDLIDPESLRDELDGRRNEPGLPSLRRLLDRHTFALTESELERRFLRLVRRLGLPSRSPARLSGATGWTSTGRSWA